jgi:ubiquitin thioesterase protein OTUB1
MEEKVPPQDTTTPTTTATTVVHTESNGHPATYQDDAAVAEQDRLTMAQQEEIEAQIAATQKLIGDLEPPSILLPAYKDNPAQGFVAGVEDLARRYRMMRRVRGDGNCFYRAFLFAYLAALVEGGVGEGGGRKREWEALTKTVKESKAWLVDVGYEEIAIDTFWEVFVEEVKLGGREGGRAGGRKGGCGYNFMRYYHL